MGLLTVCKDLIKEYLTKSVFLEKLPECVYTKNLSVLKDYSEITEY